jgi:hypothetical protein
MIQRASTDSFVRFDKRFTESLRRARLPAALLAAALLGALALLAARPGPAEACGWAPDEIDDLTTFDPHVLAGPELPGLYYDPFHAGFGPACDDCLKKALLADWAGHLGGALPPELWERILFQATLPELDALIFSAKGKKGARPPAWAPGVAKLTGPDRDKVVAALYFTGFARRVEPHAELEAEGPTSGPAAAGNLLKSGDAALARAQGGFLQQRYAFQLLRLRYYKSSPVDALAWFDANEPKLRGPSANLAARAHHYAAGAALRAGQRARGLVELARVSAREPALAPLAARDFTPSGEHEWQAALGLAADDAERLTLWTLVGLRHDALTAAQKSFALAPETERLALLLVRELTRVEQLGEDPQKVEALALQIAAAPKADRPWVAALVAAHGAALRGDVLAARARLEQARAALAKAFPGGNADVAARVAAQGEATLALALFSDVRADAAARDEAVQRAAPLPDRFDRKRALLARLKKKLALASPPALAELLQPTSTDVNEKELGRWRDPDFVSAVARLVRAPGSVLERYAVQEARYTPADLGRELAFAHVWRGEFARAAAALAADQEPLPVEPFERNWRDFRGHEPGPSYAVFGRRMVELEQRAKRPGDEGAYAAFELGVALYNLTRHAAARAVLGPLHQYTGDAAPALGWLQRAYEQARDKELRAEIAFHGAQADFAHQVFVKSGGDRWYDGPMPVPESWYARLAALEGTGYQKEALAECGYYRRWRAKHP